MDRHLPDPQLQNDVPTAKRMKSAMPTRKVTAGAISAPVTLLLLYLVNHYMIPHDPLPSTVGVAVGALITFVVQYFVPPAADEAIVDA